MLVLLWQKKKIIRFYLINLKVGYKNTNDEKDYFKYNIVHIHAVTSS
jgi:hypothetical protein